MQDNEETEEKNSYIIKYIYAILMKTVLLVRGRKEELLGKLHVSMTFRISFTYAKLLLLYGILFFLAMIPVYFGIEKMLYREKAEQIIEQIKVKGIEEIINPLQLEGINFKIIEKETGTLIYNDIIFDVTEDKRFFRLFSYYPKEREHEIILKDKMKLTQAEKEYEVYLQYNVVGEKERLQWILITFSILYLSNIYIVIISAKKEDMKLLQPIEDITIAANRLTINSLHSERINVEGTKNELKDLALVINHMLDRIETSYESQKQFVSDASHELRTPIAVIQGYVNLLDRWGKEDKDILEESIGAIKNEAASMQDLVEKLLFLSRHDKKTLKLLKEDFNIKVVVEDMIKETKMIDKKRIIYSSVLSDCVIYGDKQSLKQAIRIFIDNAIKYTKEGDIIRISCINEQENCAIIVEDSGIGMTKEEIENIFIRFYRSDTVRNKKIEGHGLGLSIARLIISAHLGSIKVISQYTVGSKFIITLPKKIL